MMPIAIRLAISVVLLAVLGFCVFGFFASYEPPVTFGAQTIYAMTAAMCALAMTGMWLDPHRAIHRSAADGVVGANHSSDGRAIDR